MAVASAIIAGVAVVGGIVSAVQAGKERSKSSRVGRAIAQLENARTRQELVRDARIQTGITLARSATQGGGGGGFGGVAGSAFQGEQISLASQLRASEKFLAKSSQLSSVASEANLRAARQETQANLFAGVASAATSVGSLFAATA